MASRISLGWMMDVDDFAGFESSYISFAQFLQGGLKMGEAYYYEYQEIKVQPSHLMSIPQTLEPFNFLHLL
jgi:hypothetical protein